MKSHSTETFETVIRELNKVLTQVLERQQVHRENRDRCIESQNFSSAATHDAMVAGIYAAEAILRDAIRENERCLAYAKATDARITQDLAGLTRVDPRGSVGERRDAKV